MAVTTASTKFEWGLAYTSEVLYLLAAQAYHRTGDASVDRAPYRTDALVTVVFAALSVEAFVNEVILIASRVLERETENYEAVKAFASLAKELEQGKGSTSLKLKAYALAITGKPLEEGRPPYQDFTLLMRLRNELVHCKPEEFGPFEVGDQFRSLKRPTVFDQLRSKNILADLERGAELPWLDMVGTRAVGRWALQTADGIMRWMQTHAPKGIILNNINTNLACRRFDPLTK